MAELFGVSLGTHLESITRGYASRQSIYGHPERKIYRSYPGYDFSVDFHGKHAATPLGPASGPHTQMAQNIILAFLGGGRIMELKTVQILDQLEIPRPCIDVRNNGFNVEWSQELRLEDSLREYIIAWVLLKIIEEMEILGIPKGDPFYDTVFDISVGYDLKGISSPEPRCKKLDRILRTLTTDFPPFNQLSPDRLTEVLNVVRLVEMRPGELMQIPGGRDQDFLFVIEGRIKFIKDGLIRTVIAAGDTHRRPVMLAAAPHSTTLLAREPSIICHAAREVLDDLISWEAVIHDHPEPGDTVRQRMEKVRNSLVFRRLPWEAVEAASSA